MLELKNTKTKDSIKQVISLVLKKETILNAKLKYYFAKNSLYASGIEILFSQDGYSFTTNILIQHFFLNHHLSLMQIFKLLLNKTIHLNFEPNRLNQKPYFQINEILNQKDLSNIFSSQLSQNDAYNGYDLVFNHNLHLSNIPKLKSINYNKHFSFSLNATELKQSYVHLFAINKPINQLICCDFINQTKQIYAQGYIKISFFYEHLTISLKQLILCNLNQTITLKLSKNHHAYFYFTLPNLSHESIGDSLLNGNEWNDLKQFPTYQNILDELNYQPKAFSQVFSKNTMVQKMIVQTTKQLNKKVEKNFKSELKISKIK